VQCMVFCLPLPPVPVSRGQLRSSSRSRPRLQWILSIRKRGTTEGVNAGYSWSITRIPRSHWSTLTFSIRKETGNSKGNPGVFKQPPQDPRRETCLKPVDPTAKENTPPIFPPYLPGSPLGLWKNAECSRPPTAPKECDTWPPPPRWQRHSHHKNVTPPAVSRR